MTGQDDKDNVLGDYAAFVKALLPQAQGFVCHDGQGRVFWSEAPPDGTPAVTDEYRNLLARILGDQPLPEGDGRLTLGDYQAYMVRLEGESGRCLGALTVLADRGAASMPYQFVVDLLAPAWRSLQRELALRVRALDSQRKLQVQAAEERLLHKVEKILHQRQSCDAALATVLRLCQEYLGTSGGFILLPDKGITLVQGTGLSRSEVQQLGEGLLAEARRRSFDSSAVNTRPDLLWLAIDPRGPDTQGVFALSGWEQSKFSERRLARVARYVVSHIDSLLDRNYDPLTGLIAWPLLEGELSAAAAEPGRGEHVVMSMDIDQLHVVNDTFGRDAGDEVLKKFAALLHEVLTGHLCSRITGDSFAALLRDTDADQARLLAEEICTRFRENVYQRGDQTHRSTVSIGIGPLLAEGEAEGASGLAAAQVACKAAKERGRARVEVYESTDVSIVRRMDDIQLVGYVRNAIENNRLALVAQPLLALKPGRVANYQEVLVRIVGDDGQHMPPAEFMSAAERYQLMEELDRWVVNTTLSLLARRGRHLRSSDARFAINLSGQSLGSDAFLAFVENSIQRAGVAPDLITFEITESVAVAKMQQAQNFMHTLKKIGCRFSLDDFGTGLSSFAYLKLFPVDTLKIDGSFIRDITTNVVSQSVVAAIAEVARVMQLETVAEYVQDQAAADLLRNLNITYAQGYFVGRTELLETAIGGIDEAVVSGLQRSMPVSN